MSHPQHPSCPDCKKALFKSPYAAKVKPSDPYAYCRNKVCPSYTFRAVVGEVGKKPMTAQIMGALPIRSDAAVNRNGPASSKVARGRSKTEAVGAILDKATEALAPPKVVPHPETGIPVPVDTRLAPAKPVSKRGAKRAAMPSSEAPPKRAPEPEPIAKARERLRTLLKQVAGDAPREAVGLVLAILTQETKSQKAAEALIDEFKLDEAFGLQKFSEA